jgi:SAM-dependent MidA family methyltransferase
MRQVLLHPVHGYYVRDGAEVFGRKGDFVTSPELTELFGELIGIWMVATWQQLGSPPMVRLVELGPGRGTLMRDALRAASKFPVFFNSLSVHLVEASPALRRKQAEALQCTLFPAGDGAGPASKDSAGAAGSGAAVESMQSGLPAAGSDAPGPTVTWHDILADVPTDGTFLCVAHELFDALPVHQIEKTSRGWRERVVEVDDDDGEHHFRLALARCETPASRYFTAVHPLSAPEGVPDDDPSLAVWSRRPGAPPTRLDGLERELGIQDDAEAALPEYQQALRAGRDGLSSLERAMKSSGGGGVRPGKPSNAAPQAETEAEAAALEDRLHQLQRLEARLRAEAAAGGADPDGEDAGMQAEEAAKASRALRAATDRFENVLKVGHRDHHRHKQTVQAPAGTVQAPAGTVQAPASAGSGQGEMSILSRLTPVKPGAGGPPVAAPGARLPTLDTIANAALAAHREADAQGALKDLAEDVMRGQRTIGDLEKLQQSPEGAGAAQSASQSSSTATQRRVGWLEAAEVGQVVEFSPASSVLASDLSARVGKQGGAALVIDYGNDYAPGGSVRGIKQHEFVSFLAEPGEVDVTADVDFRGLRHAIDCGSANSASVGPIGQGEFLQRLGIRERTEAALATLPEEDEEEDEGNEAASGGTFEAAEETADGSELSQRQSLIAAVQRLVHPDGMGTVYKALAIVPQALVSDDAPGVIGFPSAAELAGATKQE